LIVSTGAARRRVLFILALTLILGVSGYITHGYAVKSKISSSLNAATKKCYEFGGKACVIRAWACDAKG
jgi:hypothetical protein